MGFIERLRKPDWLAEMQLVVLLGLAGTVLSIGVNMWATVAGSQAVVVSVPVESVGGASGLDLPGGAKVPAEALIQVDLAEPSTHQEIAFMLTGLPTTLVVLGMLVMLWHLLGRARRGDPFTRGTVRYLRILAVLAIAGGSLASVVECVATLDLVYTITSTGYAEWEFPAIWLLAGFGFLAVGELVKRGNAMRAELETLV